MTEDLVLDAGGGLDVVASCQGFNGLTLLLGERFGHIDGNVDDFIASLTAIAINVGNTFVLQSEHCAWLCAGRDGDFRLAVMGGNFK